MLGLSSTVTLQHGKQDKSRMMFLKQIQTSLRQVRNEVKVRDDNISHPPRKANPKGITESTQAPRQAKTHLQIRRDRIQPILLGPSRWKKLLKLKGRRLPRHHHQLHSMSMLWCHKGNHTHTWVGSQTQGPRLDKAHPVLVPSA